MQGKILTGTASWTDPGFVADWYPPKLPALQRLGWYAEHFPLVEVNSTFYRIPEASMVRRWCDQTPQHFKFDVKLHRVLSRHSTKPELLPAKLRSKVTLEKGRIVVNPRLEKLVVEQFLRGIEPLESTGQLGSLLLQLSPAFRPRKHHLDELDCLIELLHGHEVAVELRNADWISQDRIHATERYFASRRLTFVMVDGPDNPHFTVLPSLDVISNPRLAYFRAHGRNANGYVRGRTVAARFDYDYPRSELKEIAQRAVAAAEQVKEVHVIYNNNKSDFAPRAALAFQKILHQKPPYRTRAEIKLEELTHA